MDRFLISFKYRYYNYLVLLDWDLEKGEKCDVCRKSNQGSFIVTRYIPKIVEAAYEDSKLNQQFTVCSYEKYLLELALRRHLGQKRKVHVIGRKDTFTYYPQLCETCERIKQRINYEKIHSYITNLLETEVQDLVERLKLSELETRKIRTSDLISPGEH